MILLPVPSLTAIGFCSKDSLGGLEHFGPEIVRRAFIGNHVAGELNYF